MAWDLPIANTHIASPAGVSNVLNAHRRLESVPIEVSAVPRHFIGIAGDREAAVALARALVLEVAALHGPADVCLKAVTHDNARDEWEWIKWLPHCKVEP